MRIRKLDILRALAVMLVLGRHWYPCPQGFNPVVRPLINAWEHCGWIGVDLFFVLSGFLISGLLFREHRTNGSIDLKRFLVRRAFKIYPAFYVYLAFAVAFMICSRGSCPPEVVISELLFVQNYFHYIFGHSWSLAVEEHFYMALPLLLLFLIKRCEKNESNPFRPLVWIVYGAASALLVFRIVTVWQVPYSDQTHLFPTHLRFDSLLFGVLLSYWHHYHPERLAAVAVRWHRWLAAGGIALVLPSVWIPLEHPFMHTVGLTLLYVGFGMILLAVLYWPSSGASRLDPLWAAVARVGVYSYSIYLWHIPMREGVLITARMVTGGDALSYSEGLVIYVVGSVLLGIGMARLVEMRALKWRDRLFPSMARPLAKPG